MEKKSLRLVSGKIKDVIHQQHPVFPGGHPSKYWLDSTLLNFGDRTRTGVFNVIWPLAFGELSLILFVLLLWNREKVEAQIVIWELWDLFKMWNLSGTWTRPWNRVQTWDSSFVFLWPLSCKRLLGKWADPRGTAIRGQPVKPALQATDLVSPGKNQINIEEDTWSSYQILSW